jgi:putative transposase
VYGKTAGAVHSLGYHVVWCPKYRRKVLVGRVADRMRELVVEQCAAHGWSVEALEVMPDHVHLFTRCAPDTSPARIAHQIKGSTSRILRSEFPHLKSRLPTLWSKSYFVASVGRVSEATIRKYIDDQTTKPIVGRP